MCECENHTGDGDNRWKRPDIGIRNGRAADWFLYRWINAEVAMSKQMTTIITPVNVTKLFNEVK